MKKFRRIIGLLAAVCLLFSAVGATGAEDAQTIQVDAANYTISQDGAYTGMEEVAVYLTVYGRLPDNFITKRDAQALGWDSREGNLKAVAPGKSIGGDTFGNYEQLLPAARGRTWTECDIDSDGGYRNAKRIVFSSDGLIYYTDDHYNTFREVAVSASPAQAAEAGTIREDGAYLTRDDVAAYLRLYGKLPANYLTRAEAKKLGWSNKKNNLGDVAPGCAIGGDSFGNREGLLPDAEGREWYECDVNAQNGKRCDQRLVWSNDGLIYYTADNHRSFERIE